MLVTQQGSCLKGGTGSKKRVKAPKDPWGNQGIIYLGSTIASLNDNAKAMDLGS